jgi:hypothetical protein
MKKQTNTPATAPQVRDATGRFLPGHPVGAATRWRNTSGNPAGVPRGRREFEQAFYQALMGEGSPEEAAKLLWQCVRAKEPWAVQCLLERVAPRESRLKIAATPEAANGTYDLSKLTDAELDMLISLEYRARGIGAGNPAPQLTDGGEVPAQPSDVR